MKIRSLSLTHYRNIERFEGALCPGQNLFVGDNGQGKTNLLEALYVLSNARSNRTAQEKDLIAHGQDFCKASALLYRENLGLEENLEVSFSTLPPARRLKTQFKAQGLPLKSRSQVLGHLPTVSFFLSDLQLVRGTPEDRRRWLDVAAAQLDPRHFSWLNTYNQIRQQKAKLLKEAPEAIDPAHLSVWNQQLAETGGRLIASRLRYLNLAGQHLDRFYDQLSGGAERLQISYFSKLLEPSEEILQTLTATELEIRLKEILAVALEARMSDECRRGVCLVGPHRDDIRISLSEPEAGLPYDAMSFASQGQQRSIVLALKLVELTLLTDKLSEAPVLLLDDVMAELDPLRQRFLLSHLSADCQLLLTTTHLEDSLLQRLPDSTGRQIFTVSGGVIQAHGG